MNTKEKAPVEIDEEEEIRIPLVWLSQDGMTTIYASQLIVTHSENDFYLLFGETIPPFITPEQLKTGVELPEHVGIQPVARIAISASKFRSFSDAIKKNIENYEAKKEDE